MLFVGPHEPYLSYVSDVLPSLGEEGVQTCTLRDLVAEGATAAPETDPEVARLKASMELVGAIEPAVALYEEPPTRGMEVVTPWADVWLSPADWAEAFTAGLGTSRTTRLATTSGRRSSPSSSSATTSRAGSTTTAQDVEPRPPAMVRRSLEQNRELRTAFDRTWPLLDAEDLVGDLWTVPAYLRRCAPALTVERGPSAPAARARRLDGVGPAPARRGPAASRRPGGRATPAPARRGAAAEREERAKVVEHLIASDDSDMHVMSMLRGEDLGAPSTTTRGRRADPDLLAGPFAHVVVDEAQELTDAEWQMLLDRCPSRSLTIVGDRAQARHGFTESWQERLARIGLDRVALASLSINYRTPRRSWPRPSRSSGPRCPMPTSRPPSARAGCPSGTARRRPRVASWRRGSPRTPTEPPVSSAIPHSRRPRASGR